MSPEREEPMWVKAVLGSPENQDRRSVFRERG